MSDLTRTKDKAHSARNVRVKLTTGMTHADMDESGRRWCLLSNYGEPDKGGNWWPVIAQVLKAWGVTQYYDIDSPPRAVHSNSCRRLMLQFADGVWRYATFGGLNGAPCAHCFWDGHAAKTGRVAWLRNRVDAQEGLVSSYREQLEAATRELEDLKKQLAEAQE